MRITSANLDETIKRNEDIQDSVKEHIAYVEKRINKWKSMSPDRQAFQILKEYKVIQVPIPDEDWGCRLLWLWCLTAVILSWPWSYGRSSEW